MAAVTRCRLGRARRPRRQVRWAPALLLVLVLSVGCLADSDRRGTEQTRRIDPAPTATATLAWEAPPTSVARALVVEDYAFVQEGSGVDYGFLVRNPNPGVAVERSDYRVVAYDAAGTVLGSATGRIARVAPEATWGAGGRLRLSSASPVAEVEVIVDQGEGVADFPTPAFRVTDVARYRLGDDRVRFTGVVHNPYRLGVIDLRIDVVFVDEEGGAVSGTVVYAGYLPGEAPIGIGEGTGGVAASTTAPGVAEARFYPTTGGSARFHDPDAWPAGAMAPVLSAQGFGRDGDTLVWGAEAHNPSGDIAIESWVLSLTAYDAQGNVLGAISGRERWLLADQRLGVIQRLTLPPGEQVARVATEPVPLSFVDAGEVAWVPRFTAEEVALEPDARFPKVSGIIVNPADRDVTRVRVVALLYDAEGAVTGGGTTYLDYIPAGGRAAVSLHVSGEAERAVRAELSATVTSRSE